jgi:hypothetical protein
MWIEQFARLPLPIQVEDRGIEVAPLYVVQCLIERCRRADWHARELAANSFQIECGHVNVASLPRSTPDRER